MHILKLLLLFTCFAACKSKTQPEITSPEPQTTTSVQSFSSDRDNLDNYFEEHELKPVLVVNNPNDNETSIQLSKHKIEWIDTDDETKIKINNDVFSLRDKATINIVWDDDKDSVDLANNWDEMKLYNFNGRELIGIRMSFHPCTGLGCGVSYFLIYDPRTKTKNFFGTFRIDNTLALYDFKNDDKLDYLSKTFKGDAHGSKPMEFIYELYSMENNGQFVQQKNVAGQPYQIKHTTFPNDTTKADTYEKRWFYETNNGR